jgi:hypothetical protein
VKAFSTERTRRTCLRLFPAFYFRGGDVGRGLKFFVVKDFLKHGGEPLIDFSGSQHGSALRSLSISAKNAVVVGGRT